MQGEHARAHPDTDFDFEIMGRVEPGEALDVLEPNTIQEMTEGVAARLEVSGFTGSHLDSDQVVKS
jgi:hypothetical protein